MSKHTKETNDIVEFGLFYYAKEYYEAAQLLKNAQLVSSPYFVLLSFSIELFLKSIGTTTNWEGVSASKVKHVEGHNLVNIFEEIEAKNGSFVALLQLRYLKKHGRNLKCDLALNSEVFVQKRYPYAKGGAIPSYSGLVFNLQENDKSGCVTVHVTQLEFVARFLYEELIVFFGGMSNGA